MQWSRSVVSDSLQPPGLQPARLLCPWDSPGKNTGVGFHFLPYCTWTTIITAFRWTSVTAQFYLESKGKYILEAWGHADPKDVREERERDPWPFGSSLYVFSSSSWTCPMWIGLAQSAVFSTWGPHSSPRTFLCSIFVGFSLPYLLATTILDSFLLFCLPNGLNFISFITSIYLE